MTRLHALSTSPHGFTRRLTTGLLSTLIGASLLSACGDKAPQEPQGGAQVEAPKGPPPFSLKRAPEELSLSEDVLSFGGSNVLGEDLKLIYDASQRLLARPLDLREMWLKTFVQTSFLITSEHIDEARPFRFVQLVHEGEPHTVRLIGIKDLEALKKDLGEYFEAQSEGGQTLYALKRYRKDTEPLYYAPLAHGMFATTKIKALLTPAHLSMYEQLSEVRFEGLGALHLYPKRLLERWGERELIKAEESIEELELKGPSDSQERQRALLSGGTQLVRELARDSERVTLSLELQEDRLRVRSSWRALSKSPLAARLSSLKGGEHALLGALTEPTPIALSLNLKTEQLASLSAMLNEGSFTKALLRDDQALLKGYVTHAVSAASRLKGQLLFAGVVPKAAGAPSKAGSPKAGSPKAGSPKASEEPPADQNVLDALNTPLTSPKHLSWLALMDHTSQAGTQSALDALWAMYQDKALIKALKHANIYAKVSADAQPPEGLTSTHLQARMPRTSRALAPLRPQLKELYDAHVAVGSALVGVGFGEAWRESLSLLTQPTPSASSAPEGIQRALKAGAPNPFAFFYLDPIALLTHLKQGRAGSMLLPLQMMASGLKINEGLSLSAGVLEREERVEAQLTLNLPFNLLNALSRGFAGMGLGLAPPPPPPPPELPSLLEEQAAPNEAGKGEAPEGEALEGETGGEGAIEEE